MLYPTEDFKVYGYITNSSIKLIVVLDDTEVKEAEMKTVRRYSFCQFLLAILTFPIYDK